MHNRDSATLWVRGAVAYAAQAAFERWIAHDPEISGVPPHWSLRDLVLDVDHWMAAPQLTLDLVVAPPPKGRRKRR